MARQPRPNARIEAGGIAPPGVRQTANNSAATRRHLLAAAEACLREHGYGALSTRQVARAADVPLSQIHYHFGSKQGLLVAIFEDLNKRLLHRQTEMFASDLPLWRQWQLACDYLDEDLESGFVRILHELAAAGWSDATIGAAVRQAITGWHTLLVDVTRQASARFGGLGPLTPEDVGALVGCAFFGAEMTILSGLESSAIPARRALRRLGDLIRQLEETYTEGT